MAPTTVHIIEDEEDIIELLTYNLVKAGYEVSHSVSGQEGLSYLLQNNKDILLLDLMLPEIKGIDICKTLKMAPQTKNLPIIMLTALGSESDIIAGLEAGADDYITKPFSSKIVIARIKALLRRVSQNLNTTQQDVLKRHELTLNKGRFEILLLDQKVDLTYSEFHILWQLMGKPGWVFTRSQIVDLIRGEDHAITDRAVDVQIVGLRKKLGDYQKYIETVRGVGYRFRE